MACGFFNGGVNIECYDDAMWFGDPSITKPYERYGGNAANNGTLMSDFESDQAFWDYYWDVIDGPGGSNDTGPTFSTTGYGVADPDFPVLSGYDPFTQYSDATWNILYGGVADVPVYPDPVTQQCDCSAAVAAAKAACPSTKPSGSDSGTKPSGGSGGSGGGASLPATNGQCPQGYRKYGNLCIAPQQQQAAKKDNAMLWLILIVIAILLYQE